MKFGDIVRVTENNCNFIIMVTEIRGDNFSGRYFGRQSKGSEKYRYIGPGLFGYKSPATVLNGKDKIKWMKKFSDLFKK